MKIYIESFKRGYADHFWTHRREDVIDKLRKSVKKKSVREVAKMLFAPAYQPSVYQFDFTRLTHREILTAIDVRNTAYQLFDLVFQTQSDIRNHFPNAWKRLIAKLALKFLSAHQLGLLAYHQKVTENPQLAEEDDK